jgi:hypothetical protein
LVSEAGLAAPLSTISLSSPTCRWTANPFRVAKLRYVWAKPHYPLTIDTLGKLIDADKVGRPDRERLTTTLIWRPTREF